MIEWFKREWRNILLTFFPALLGMFFSLLKALFNDKEHLGNILEDYKFGSAFQAFFIFITLFVLLNTQKQVFKNLSKVSQLKTYLRRKCILRDENNENLTIAYEVVLETVKQFYYLWIAIWGLWFMYYCGDFILNVLESARNKCSCDCGYIGDNLIFQKISFTYKHFFDFLTSVLMYILYLILSEATVKRKERKKTNISEIIGGFLFLLLLGVIVMCLEIYSYSIFAPYQYHRLNLVISIILSIFSAFSFVLILGKLNSNYLQIPRVFLYGLYIYAIIQIYHPFLECYNDQTLNALFFYATLLGKVFLTLTLTWIVYNYRFIYFVIHKSLALTETPEKLKTFERYMSNSK